MINFLFKSGYFKVFLICWLSYSTSLIGQDGVQFVCPSDELLKEHINSDPSINQMRILYEDNYRKYVEKERFQKTLENVYTLPVVLHIVHSGQPIGSIQNPSDQSLQDLISESNMRFRHMHADAQSYSNPNYGIDVNIEFCLAQRGPQNEETNGIVRHFNPALAVGNYNTLGEGLDGYSWDKSKYVNLFIIKNLTNAAGVYISTYDIIIYDSEILWSGLVVHELGHYLSLKHTFSETGSCVNNNCLIDGDQVCDTPPKPRSGYGNGTCGTPANSCSTDEDDLSENNPYRAINMGGLGDQLDMLENYMDYTGPCWDAFTLGQKTRMRFNIEQNRMSLLSSLGCIQTISHDAGISSIIYPLPTIYIQNCSSSELIEPIVILENTGFDTLTSVAIQYSIDGDSTYSYDWSGNLLPSKKIEVKLNPIPINDGFHNFSVETLLPNGETDGYTLNDSNMLDFVCKTVNPFSISGFNTIGSCQDGNSGNATVLPESKTEIIEDWEGDSDWIIVNGNQINQWVIGNETSSKGEKSIYISSNGVSNQYEPSAFSVVYVFKDFYFPSDATDINLKFDWKCFGNSGDFLTAFVLDPLSFDPKAGIYVPLTNGNYFGSQANFITTNINLGSVAGQRKRILFRWLNSSTVGNQPPAAIDNIIVSYNRPQTSSYTYTWNTDPIQNLQTATSLSAGIYQVTITDDNGCYDVDSVQIGIVESFKISGLVENSTCIGSGDGSIEILVDPTTEIIEDWEGYSDWIIVNGDQPNQWIVGNDVANGGDRSIYISRDGNSNIYNPNVTTEVHFYKDFYFPSDASNIIIKFDFKGTGSSSDYLDFLIYESNSENSIAGFRLNNQAEFTTKVFNKNTDGITNIESYAGTTKRLLFKWVNNSSYGAQPPAAIDNIIVSYQLPFNSPYTFEWNTNPIQTTSTATNLEEGNYQVTVTDNLGCSQIDSFSVECTPNDAGIVSVKYPLHSTYIDECRNPQPISPVVVLKNYSYSPLNFVEVKYQIDNDSLHTYLWVGNLLENETDDLLLPPIPISDGNHTLLVFTSLPNGFVDDDNVQNDTLRFDFSLNIPKPFDISGIVENSTCRDSGDGSIEIRFDHKTEIIEDWEGDSDWIIVNGSETNQWFVGNATSNGGERSIYISNNNNSNQYTTNASSIVHFYKDYYFPSDATDIKLKFDWKGNGEIGYDYLKLSIVDPSTTTPIAGLSVPYTLLLNKQNTFTNRTVTLSSYAGESKRIVFSWYNDYSAGTQPPAAVDNIIVSYQLPFNSPYSFEWNTNPVQTTSTATNLEEGNYQVTVTDSQGCSQTESFSVECIPNDAGITSLVYPIPSIYISDCFPGDSINPIIVLKNYSYSPLNSVEIKYQIDSGSTYTYLWNGNLLENETDELLLPSIPISGGDHTFLAYTRLPNGFENDDNIQNDTLCFKFTSHVVEPFEISGFVENSTCRDSGDGSIEIQVDLKTEITEDWESSSDWVIVNGEQTNKWVIGSATSNGGSRSMYISNFNNLNLYSINNASIVHFYKDFYFPPDATDILVKFDCIGIGESGYDYLNVNIVSPSVNLVPGMSTPASSEFNYSDLNSFVTNEIAGIDAYAGSIKRIVFTWKNDNLYGTQPPIAIDNIIVSYIRSGDYPFTYDWNTFPAQNSSIATGLNEGNYQVTVSSSKGCSKTASFSIECKNLNDAGISDVKYPISTIYNSNCTMIDSFHPVLVLSNYHFNPLTSVEINYKIDDDSLQTVDWTGSLAGEDSTEISLPDIPISPGNHSLLVFTNNPNGFNDVNTQNDTIVFEFTSKYIDPFSLSSAVVNTSCSEVADGSISLEVEPFIEIKEDWEGDPDWILSDGDHGIGWTVGSEISNGGTNSVYVQNNGTLNDRLEIEFYKDFIFPSDASNISIKFDFAASGIAPAYLTLSITDPETIQLSEVKFIPLSNVSDIQNKFITEQWTKLDILAGTKKRIIFNWRGQLNESIPIPIAIDNITVSYQRPQQIPFSFKWSTDSILDSPVIANLHAGEYVVTATDGEGCTLTDTIQVFDPPVLDIAVNKIDNICYGDSLGEIVLIPQNGIMPYEYQWSSGQFSDAISNLKAGTYAYTITDHGGFPDSMLSEPLCSPVTLSNCCGIGIYHVNFNAIDHSSMPGNEGYQNNDFITTYLDPGSSYDLTVTSGVNYNERVVAWIDFNNNRIFEDAEMVMQSQNNLPNRIHFAKVFIPFDAVQLKPLRMRIGSDYFGNPFPTPCSSTQFGQFEDYSILIGSPACATGSIDILDPEPFVATVVPGDTIQYCPGDSILLSANSAQSYSWSNGDTLQEILLTSVGSFQVTLTNEEGCTAVSNQVEIIAGDECNTESGALISLGGQLIDNADPVLRTASFKFIDYFPNPASSTIYLRFNTTSEMIINMEIYDLLGRIITRKNIQAVNGLNIYQMTVVDYLPGAYLISLGSGVDRHVFRMVKQ